MDYKKLLALILEKSPDSADQVAELTTLISKLNSESAERRVNLVKAEETIKALKAIAGDDTDLVIFTGEAKKKAEASDATIADMQAKLDAALALAAASQRELLLVSASQKSGADPKALAELLKSVDTAKIAVGEKDVTVEGKPLKDYAIEQGQFWERALFTGSPATPEGVPTGGASPDNTKETPADAHLKRRAADVAQMLGATITKST
jgi:hypothetical protein